jgi:hypothetical protein
MKEEVAKTKWCPEGRTPATDRVTGHTVAVNRAIHKTENEKFIVDPSQSLCFGSECMWWMWSEYYKNEGGRHTDDGYCGKVGDQPTKQRSKVFP